jgi:hypothetical protein
MWKELSKAVSRFENVVSVLAFVRYFQVLVPGLSRDYSEKLISQYSASLNVYEGITERVVSGKHS